MFADCRTRPGPQFGPSRRRGVVLILILAMLSIVALIGVTFVSFSNQARLGARSYALGQVALKPEAIFDYAISQLINDTSNPKSAIRGHSLLRDMYGNDATNNGYLYARPDGVPLMVTNVASAASAGWTTFTITTNIDPSAFPDLYGANYIGAVLRLQQWAINSTTLAPVAQILTYEGQYDNYGRITHTFEITYQAVNGSGFLVFTLSPVRTSAIQTGSNSTPGLLMPGYPAPGGGYTLPSGTTAANLFEIDGRYQRGFNGSGLSEIGPLPPKTVYTQTQPYFPNFLFNLPNPVNPLSLTGLNNTYYNDPDHPGIIRVNNGPWHPTPPGPAYQQMDEDYDAPDLENLFMGLVSADGQTIIPSFHRPGIIVYDPNNANDPASNDWLNYPTNMAGASALNNTRRAKFLRPRAVDHPQAAAAGEFPDLIPDPQTGKITYDVDNDGDGVTDSVWLDLGFPVQRDASGKLYKPLFAFLVVPLNGRLPLNTAGNLAKRVINGAFPMDASNNINPQHTAHLGNSPTEIDPRYALRNPAEKVGNSMLQVLLQGNPAATNGPEVGRYGEPEMLAAATGGSAFPRAGRSYAGGSAYLDGLDGNYNTLDFYPQDSAVPPRYFPERGDPTINPTTTVSGDLYDAIGRVQLPSERIRRFVTPHDPTGNGRIMEYDQPPLFQADGVTTLFSDFGGGFDNYGRVGYFQYFRPPGVPGDTVDTTISPAPADGFVPHNTLNLFHGFESHRNPTGKYEDLMARGPDNQNYNAADTTNYKQTPINLPTFNLSINSTTPTVPTSYVAAAPFLPGLTGPTTTKVQVFRGMYPGGSLLLHDADQMDLYRPTSYDALFGPKDLEWLYRQGDIDGSSLDNRLARLVPDAFQNPNDPDGSRVRRNLFSVETWELNTYASRNAAQPGSPPYMVANGFPVTVTPTLMHGGRKINLNYPLPYSNDPREQTRQKWCQDVYQFLKDLLYPINTTVGGRVDPHRIDPSTGLPVLATPEQLAELGQFVVNIIDFRDPDAAMTAFVNPDLAIKPPATVSGTKIPAGVKFISGTESPLVQYGMEYPPIAINEVLAFQSVISRTGGPAPQKRLFIELANLLTKNADGFDSSGASVPGTASDLDLKGWGFVITHDNPGSTTSAPEATFERPNTVTGQIDQATINKYYVPIGGTGTGLGAGGNAVEGALDPPVWAMGADGPRDPDSAAPPDNKYYVLSNSTAGTEINAPEKNNTDTASMDELAKQLPNLAIGSGNNDYLWLHLVRPANPLDPDSAKVIVDSIRFPYIENGVTYSGSTRSDGNQRILYSVGRLQPYRGGQIVPTAEQFTPAFPYGYTEQVSIQDQDDEEDAYKTQYTMGIIVQDLNTTDPDDVRILNTLGDENDPDDSPWDYLPFHDRDFTSVAELLLVPNCPPGLFTKVFAEATGTKPVSPTDPATYVPPLPTPDGDIQPDDLKAIDDTHAHPYLPDAFFYTNYQYDYTGNNLPPTYFGSKTVGWHRMLEYFEVPSPMFGAIGPAAQGQNADWFRQDVKPGLLNINTIIDEEVFFGLMADERMNFEPAFLDSTGNVSEAVAARPYPVNAVSALWPTNDAITGNPTTSGVFGVPRVVSAIYPNGIPSYTYPISDLTKHGLGRGYPFATTYTSALTGNTYHDYMKAAFSDFLKLRHGGSGLVFSPYANSRANWTTLNTPPSTFQTLPERPFRSLSSSDIYDTILRPARLYNISDQFALDKDGNVVTLLPGRRPETLQIPPRRLFQIPDEALDDSGPPPPNDAATFDGSPYANDATPYPASGTYGLDHVNLYQYPTAPIPGPRPNLVTPLPDLTTGNSLFLGANHREYPDPADPTDTIERDDHRRHPYFRTEWLQKLMNLTTVRSHQYAVWVTVGFFEVVREGNPQMANSSYPILAIDKLGPEIGKAEGRNVRHRSFYIIDRTRATGFDPANPADFRKLIIHESRIE